MRKGKIIAIEKGTSKRNVIIDNLSIRKCEKFVQTANYEMFINGKWYWLGTELN